MACGGNKRKLREFQSFKISKHRDWLGGEESDRSNTDLELEDIRSFNKRFRQPVEICEGERTGATTFFQRQQHERTGDD